MILLRNHQQRLNGSNLLIFIVFISISTLFSQSKTDYENGIKNFNNGDYKQAIYYLEIFTKKRSEYSEKANLLIILSYFRLNELENAKRFIASFETNYPASNSIQLVIETKLAIAVLQKDFNEIRNSLLSLNQFKFNKSQVNDFIAVFKTILSFIDKQQSYDLEKIITNQILRFAYLKALFMNLIDQKSSDEIRKVYNELLQIGFKNDLLNVNKIGVLIPIESKHGTAENLIIEGLKFAIHRFNDLREKNYELKIFKGDEKLLESAIIQLAKDPEVLCIIGPLYSSQFKKLATLADRLCIPLISPTATATDISFKSKYIFQFNPTLDVRGFAMASFAIDKLRLSRFALLSSDNSTSKPISKEIREKIKNSKSELLIDLLWNENKKTLSAKIKEIRKAAAKRDQVIRFNQLMDFETEQKLVSYGMEQSKIDSLKTVEAEVSIFEIFGRDAEKICQNLRIPFYKRTKYVADDLSIPLYSIDAVFIPISNNKIISDITNEFEKQNIITKIIGNDIWNSLEELNKAYPSSNGIYFTSDFYFDTDDYSFKNLANEVYEYTQLQLNRTFFYGFETANKILENWNDEINRENFYNVLVNDRNYEGIVSDIILNKNGINSSVFVLQYKNRKIIKVERMISN